MIGNKGMPNEPGMYRFKPYSMLPWTSVQVIKESVLSPSTLRVRCAGLTLSASLFQNGYWEGPINQ